MKTSCFVANQGPPGPNKSWFNSRVAGSFKRNPEKPDPHEFLICFLDL